jgi:Protein of unknown function (DUF2795)
MSEQVSAKHGPAEDDHIKRQDRTEIQEHGEEWPDLQDVDVWPDNGIWAPESRLVAGPAGPDFRAIELRSELARHLDRAMFPATREELTRVLTDRQAEPRLLGLVSALPPGSTVSSVGELIRTAGLPVEEHRT